MTICMMRWIATAVLAIATLMASLPAWLSTPMLRNGNLQRAQARPQPHPGQGHAGDWLRRYQGLSSSERERALQNDPGFRRLSPERQQLLRQRLQHFSSLPPRSAAAHAQSHGNLGALDSRPKAAGARFIRPDAATSFRSAPHGDHRGARSARHAASRARAHHRFRLASKLCSHPRSATSCAAQPVCRWRRRMAEPKNRRNENQL